MPIAYDISFNRLVEGDSVTITVDDDTYHYTQHGLYNSDGRDLADFCAAVLKKNKKFETLLIRADIPDEYTDQPVVSGIRLLADAELDVTVSGRLLLIRREFATA